MNAGLSFAVVVPFFNEERNVGPVCRELRKIVRKQLSGGELVLIDDGSNDATGAILDELAVNWPECRVYHFERNQGQSAALLFAFSKTTAPVIVTMDGDGQNDPRDIPKLLARLDEADMVVGARARKDSWVRRYISRVANRVRANWLGDRVSDSGCALKAFRREVASAFIPIRTLYSFMPALAVAAGFRVTEEPVNHRCREHGSSRYTVRFSPLSNHRLHWRGLVQFAPVQSEVARSSGAGRECLWQKTFRPRAAQMGCDRFTYTGDYGASARFFAEGS